MGVFLSLDGVDGESTDDRHAGQIELESWAFGVSNSGTTHMGGGGAGAGNASFTDLSLTKHVDVASPALLQATAGGKRRKTATLSVSRSGAAEEDYLVLVLHDVLVTGCSLSGGSSEPPTETVTLSFGKVQLTYTAQTPDGTAGPATSFGWDVTRNGAI